MAKQSNKASELPTLKLSGFAPAISSLLALGVPASRLAELFGTNANHIHVLAHRGREARGQKAPAVTTAPSKAIADSSADGAVLEAKQALRIRAEEDGVELTPRKAAKLEWLEAQMEEITSTGRATYQFLRSARQLRALAPYIGYPSESNRLRLAAKLHQLLAWFYSHSGLSSSSIAEAEYSTRLFEIVHHNTDDKDSLRELGGSCLIASNSRLIQGQAQTAITTLNLSGEATMAARVALNSEYFKQRGVALFQAGQDEQAKASFERAMETIPDDDAKYGTMTLKMAGDRHLNLIAKPFPEVDDQLVLLEEAKQVYGPESLEASMCVHWAAACLLCTDSRHAESLALHLIEENQSTAARFGHQATIARLLPIAAELPFNKRSLWVRIALYQNAFRTK
jgi:hypothetical protein